MDVLNEVQRLFGAAEERGQIEQRHMPLAGPLGQHERRVRETFQPRFVDVITQVSVEIERAAIDLLTRRMTASVNLIKALGGGWNTGVLPSD